MALVLYKGDTQPEVPKAEQKFTGLFNQGATCYMNSLLQSLYMTPELRKKIYDWKYDERKHGDKKLCIPYQLQVLFAKLQISKRQSIDTKHLTQSFGWDTKESFQQHDVQEFCRVLFDAIEESVKNTDSENLISSLYEGEMTDYVKCLTCQYESRRTDKFLDLSLTVRNDFENVKNDSIEKALQNYIKPELLNGGNQYRCDLCNIKVDAVKGLKIEKFPYILVLQIKRFDLNYQTLQRIKLNDRVTFPQILNGNSFINGFKENISIAVESLDEETSISLPELKLDPPENIEFQILKTTSYESIMDDRDKRPLQHDSIVKDRILSEQTEKRKQKQVENIELYKKEGDNVYELFSIMIHSGSAMGGHYYAYIKNFEDYKWYNFNDSNVKEIEEKEITKVFGGEISTSSWGVSYSANAYLLMYRKISPENHMGVSDFDIPPYVKTEIQEQLENDQKEAKVREEKNLVIHFKVLFNKKEEIFSTKKNVLLKEFKLEVMKEFNIEENPENVRLRSYASHYEIMQDVYDEEKLVSAIQAWDYKMLAVEIKKSEDEWKPYDPNGMLLKVYLWDDVKDLTTLPDHHKIFINKNSNVDGLLTLLESEFKLAKSEILVYKKAYFGLTFGSELVNEAKNLEVSMTMVRLYEGSQIYIEKKSEKTHWKDFIDLEARRYTIKFNHPNDPLNNFNLPEYKHSVVIDQQASLNDLKKIISEKIDIPENKFLMKRGGAQSQELKEMNSKLVNLNIMNNCIIYIEKGEPTLAGQYKLLYSIAVKPKPNELKSHCYSFIELFDMITDAESTIFNLKKKLCDKILDYYPSLKLTPERIRLRDRNQERLLKVLKNNETLRYYSIYDKKCLSLQILEENEEELPLNSIIVNAKRWNPSKWEISEPQEFIIDKSMSMAELGKIFSEYYGIPVEKLMSIKLAYGYAFSPTDLLKETFLNLSSQQNLISQSPWYVSIDGVLFFVKSIDETPRELTEEEKKTFEKPTRITYYDSTSSSTWKYVPPKEKGIKITVSKKEEQDQKLEFKNTEASRETITDGFEGVDKGVGTFIDEATGDTDGTEKKEQEVNAEEILKDEIEKKDQEIDPEGIVIEETEKKEKVLNLEEAKDKTEKIEQGVNVEEKVTNKTDWKEQEVNPEEILKDEAEKEQQEINSEEKAKNESEKKDQEVNPEEIVNKVI